MRKLLSASLLGVILTMSFASGATARTHSKDAPPVQGTKLAVMMYVDTVQGAAGNPKPTVGCSITNLFRRGQQVVFRMWGVNTKLGGAALTPKNVKSAVVNIPGVGEPLKMNYSAHPPTGANQVSFWSVPWPTTQETPLGVVNFTVVVTTKAVKYHGKKVKSFKATFSQAGLAAPSQLTVTP